MSVTAGYKPSCNTNTIIEGKSESTDFDGLISFDFTLKMKSVRPDLTLLFCLSISVMDSQNLFPSVTQSQILDNHVT